MAYLLHLSDLHFIAKDPHCTITRLARDLADDVRSILDGADLSAIAISGDIVYQSDPHAYGPARQFLEHLATILPIDKNNIVIVPGNHDVSKTVCEDILAAGLSPPTRSSLEKKRFEQFGKFYNAFYKPNSGFSLAYEDQWSALPLHGDRIYVLGLSSVYDWYPEIPGQSAPRPNTTRSALRPWTTPSTTPANRVIPTI